MLNKLVLIDHLLELVHLDIIVVYVSLLARTRVACCMRDGRCEGVRVPIQEEFVECTFPHARRTADHDRTVIAGYYMIVNWFLSGNLGGRQKWWAQRERVHKPGAMVYERRGRIDLGGGLGRIRDE
jgi:hypothetical protein